MNKGGKTMSRKAMMMAAVYEKVGILSIKEVPIPKLKNPEDVLIKVEAISICGTDVRALSDPPEFLFNENIIIGHEFSGIVEKIGQSVTNVQIGDRVVVHPNLWCGKCYYCRTGQLNLCTNFIHIGDKVDGGMAGYSCVPERLVYKISKQVPPYIACLAEPLACVLNATTTVRVHPGENVVILGSGPIGLIFLMIYKAAGAKVIVSDILEKRNEFALKMGADFTINPKSTNLEEGVKSTIKDGGVDLVTDTVGFLMDQALKLVKKGGHVVLFGINERIKIQLNQAPIVFNEVNIHGVFIAKGTFPMAIRLLESRILPIEKLVTHRLPIKDAKKGIDLMRKGEGIKVIIEP